MASRLFEVLTVKVGGDVDEVLEGLNKIGVQVDQAGRRMQRTGRNLTRNVTLPIAAIGTAAVLMASSAEESANKFNVVMGGAAQDVRAELQELTKTIPLTTAEMEKMAGGLQDMLVPMGVARSEAAGMSADMVRMAGDVASFNDVVPTEVLNAMSSALAGSSEPMRRFGVDTRVARLEALALEAGLIKQGEELDNAARAQAVMLAIQRDSTDAMGDAARTVDSTSNSIKFLRRDLKELSITLGRILIPVVTPIIGLMTDFTGVLLQLDPEILQVAAGIAAAAAAIGPLVLVGGKMVSMFALALSPAGLVVAALAGLATTALVVVKNWDVLQLKGTLAWTALKDVVLTAVSDILGALERIPLVGGRFANMRAEIDELAENSLVRANERIREMEAAINSIGAAAAEGSGLGGVAEEAQALAENTGAMLVPAVSDVKQGLLETNFITADTITLFKSAGESALVAGENFDQLSDFTSALGQKMGEIAMSGLDAFVDFATGAGNSIGQFVKKALRDLTKLILKMAVVRGLMNFLPGVGQFLGLANFAGGFAQGGFIPAGMWGVTGEAGPERVVTSPTAVAGPAQVTPLSDQGATTVKFSFPPAKSPTDAARDPQIAMMFIEAIETIRGNGYRFES